MKRIAILTAGGDTPALNATIYGAVERANRKNYEIYGIIKGFNGMLDRRMPYVRLNPLFATIPEIDPRHGGTVLGASRTYVDPSKPGELERVADRIKKLRIDGLICIGGDGTISGMQPLSDLFPCVLAPKTIDNDLGLNYHDEPNEWERTVTDGAVSYTRSRHRAEIDLREMINYVTPGYATAVYVAAQGIERIRTTAESHRRIAIVEVMGRDSGFIALGCAYGQPDIILIPEVPLNFESFKQRVLELYERQKHVVIVIGEGVRDEQGHVLGAVNRSHDPAGNILFSGAAETLRQMLIEAIGDQYFIDCRRHDSAREAIFTRKVGHTQRGGRPIKFDRFYAIQLGGKAVELFDEGHNNSVATLQWSPENGFRVEALVANKLRDRWGKIHPRQVHPSFYDPERFRVSNLGRDYLLPIFTSAIGTDDVEHIHADQFSQGKLYSPYESINVDMHRRIRHLSDD